MKLRERIFNWFANGHLSVNSRTTAKERLDMSSPAKVSGPMGPSGQLTISGMQLGGQMAQDTNSSTLVVKITQAIGGTIVNISGQYDNHLAEIYVIPDGNNFDTELGKIITHARLKRG